MGEGPEGVSPEIGHETPPTVEEPPAPDEGLPSQEMVDRDLLRGSIVAHRQDLAKLKAQCCLARAGVKDVGHPEQLLKSVRNTELALSELERLLHAGMPSPSAKVIEIAHRLPDPDVPAAA